MGRTFLVAAQLVATVLFISVFERSGDQVLPWVVPMVLLILVVVNSFWFTRLVSWLIFSVGFFYLLVLLSAFTVRWTHEPGFAPGPFYRAMGLYTALIYVSLGQINILGQQSPKDSKDRGGGPNPSGGGS